MTVYEAAERLIVMELMRRRCMECGQPLSRAHIFSQIHEDHVHLAFTCGGCSARCQGVVQITDDVCEEARRQLASLRRGDAGDIGHDEIIELHQALSQPDWWGALLRSAD